MKMILNIEKKEAEAKAAGVKHVINMLQRPGQLEKVNITPLVSFICYQIYPFLMGRSDIKNPLLLSM